MTTLPAQRTAIINCDDEDRGHTKLLTARQTTSVASFHLEDE